MTTFAVEGRVSAVLAMEGGIGRNGRQWRKQIFVVAEPDRDRDNPIPFELWGDRIDEYQSLLVVGQPVRVLFNISGTVTPQGRWFTCNRAFYMAAAGDVAENTTTSRPTATESHRSLDELRADIVNQFNVNKK